MGIGTQCRSDLLHHLLLGLRVGLDVSLRSSQVRMGRWIKQYHLRHHFISEKHWFGVSNPALDGVFGTLHGPDAAEKSTTTRHLY
jgi:hypothetical protein